MATGDLTASPPVFCTTSGALVTAIGALNLASGADLLHIVPDNTLEHGFWVFKVARSD